MPTKVGFIHGTGAALNLEIGFIPDYVHITNLQNSTAVQYHCFLGKVIVFTSLSTAIRSGNWIKGITSGAKARIREVILATGTIAGGDSAGFLICNAEDITGTIESENAQVYTQEPGTTVAATDHLGIVVDVELGVDIETAVVAVTGDAGILSYTGNESSNFAKGFTIGSTISVDGELLGYMAVANDPGQAQGPKVIGTDQGNEPLWV